MMFLFLPVAVLIADIVVCLRSLLYSVFYRNKFIKYLLSYHHVACFFECVSKKLVQTMKFCVVMYERNYDQTVLKFQVISIYVSELGWLIDWLLLSSSTAYYCY